MIDLIKEYVTKRADLLQLQATEKSVTILGTVVYLVLLLFSVVFFTLLFLFGIGFLIGSYLNNYGFGLLIVAGIFLVLLIAVVVNRKTIKSKIANKILESFED